MLISTIGSSPPSGYIIDIINYPASADPEESLAYKSIHCFSGPQLDVATGVSTTSFTVSAGDSLLIFEGAKILVHDTTYSSVSPEITVETVSGTTITTRESMTFVPTSSYKVDIVGFVADGGAAYRYL